MTREELVSILLERGLISSPAASITALSGGVSCDIFLIEDGAKRFVLKQALPKLRVKDDWFADVNRNRTEQEYIDYVSRFLPDAMPRILHRDPEHGFFTMEYLGGEFQNWKTLMLAGTHELWHAEEAGRILGTIHRTSWNDPVARERFATDKNFYDLRIESYILTTGRRHPKLQPLFEAEAKRLAATKICLVHGDYTPKNILVSSDRMMVLDCEVAWFGDPVFDVASILNHLVLKMLMFHREHEWRGGNLQPMAVAAWMRYLEQMPELERPALNERTARLLPMLMLARADGKSPVEYLNNEQRDLIRSFAATVITRRSSDVLWTIEKWVAMLAGE